MTFGILSPLSVALLQTSRAVLPNINVPNGTEISEDLELGNLMDKLLIFSRIFWPRCWYGVLTTQTQNPFSKFNGAVLFQAAAALLLPIVFLATSLRWPAKNCRRFPTLQKGITSVFLYTIIGSPWSLTMMNPILQEASYLIKALQVFVTTREKAMNCAVQVLKERIRDKTATRRRAYDMYWPSLAYRKAPAYQKQKAIILLPGRGVSHTAYSTIASRLADQRNGFIVVVPSMEPFRLPHRHLGAGADSIKRIMKQVEEQYFESNTLAKADSSGLSWSLVGHSAGCFAAMDLFKELYSNGRIPPSGDDCFQVEKLVLWACAALPSLGTDLSHLKSTNEKLILVLEGTEDTFVSMTKSQTSEFEQLFPKELTAKQIMEGATHHGFASYDPERQWTSPSSEAAPRRTLTYEKQQDQACTLTTRFINDNLFCGLDDSTLASDCPYRHICACTTSPEQG